MQQTWSRGPEGYLLHSIRIYKRNHEENCSKRERNFHQSLCKLWLRFLSKKFCERLINCRAITSGSRQSWKWHEKREWKAEKPKLEDKAKFSINYQLMPTSVDAHLFGFQIKTRKTNVYEKTIAFSRTLRCLTDNFQSDFKFTRRKHFGRRESVCVVLSSMPSVVQGRALTVD